MVQQELETKLEKLSLEPIQVRILLVGDAGVGKTSLIHSLVHDKFDPNLPARAESIEIPAHVTPEKVPIKLVDYSSREQTNAELIETIRLASVICLVFEACDDESINRLSSHWIPTIKRAQKDSDTHTPIILVANKIDLIPENRRTLEKVAPIVRKLSDIEAFVEVSALKQVNVIELFSQAQKAVACPLAPLFDSRTRTLTKKCQDALKNIFNHSDLDGDGLLNDRELNLFQDNCFGIPLQKNALEDLKLIIKQSTVDGIVNDCMTQTGFLFLHTLTIDKGRHEFTWQVLKKFGYDTQLSNQKIITTQPEDNPSQRDSSDLLSDIDEDRNHHRQTTSEVASTIGDNEDEEEQVGLMTAIPQTALACLSEHSKVTKIGLGITVGTLVSMIALRYIFHGSRLP